MTYDEYLKSLKFTGYNDPRLTGNPDIQASYGRAWTNKYNPTEATGLGDVDLDKAYLDGFSGRLDGKVYDNGTTIGASGGDFGNLGVTNLNNGYGVIYDTTGKTNTYIVRNPDGTFTTGGEGLGDVSQNYSNYEGLKTGLAGVNAAANIMNAVTGWKSLGLAKDQFNFEKAAANRNLQNQGLAYNTAVDKAAGIVAAGSGTMNQQQADAYRKSAEKNYMDTRAI